MSTVLTEIKIGPHWNGAHLTPEEFDSVTDWEDGFRYELVNGVLIANPRPASHELRANEFLGCLLTRWFENRRGERLVLLDGNEYRIPSLPGFSLTLSDLLANSCRLP